VSRALELREGVVAQLVAGDAELLGAGEVDRGGGRSDQPAADDQAENEDQRRQRDRPAIRVG
jgi:hypothetical protein